MSLNPTLSEWLNLVFRWVHVFAGIMWVGTTYYFTWLDARLSEEEKAVANTGTAAQLWMVHSGGFYVVEKQKVPQVLPEKLHWFKWEAALTWVSGLLLFMLVYYHGGLMVEFEGARISPAAAIAFLLGVFRSHFDGPWMVCVLAALMVACWVTQARQQGRLTAA